MMLLLYTTGRFRNGRGGNAESLLNRVGPATGWTTSPRSWAASSNG
jgi:hypothetical protein